MNIYDAMLLVRKHAQECDCADTYGERRYDNPENGILLANWNNVPDHIKNGLERRGFALEWSDEWVTSTGGKDVKAYRSSPTYHGWTPYYVQTEDGEIIGGDDIENDKDDLRSWYVEEYLLNDPKHCNVFNIDLAKMGFTLLDEEYETGFHPGQNDSPGKVLERLQESLPDRDFVFNLTDVGQFDCKWEVWSRSQG